MKKTILLNKIGGTEAFGQALTTFGVAWVLTLSTE